MNGNINNGGLAVVFKRRMVLSDFNKQWYMNADDEFIYFSDVSRGGYICRMNDDDTEGSVLLKKPCLNVVLRGDWLYYINEKDGRIYRCLRGGRSESLLVNEKVTEFIPFFKDDLIYVSANGGIKALSGFIPKNNIRASRICIASGKIWFANADENWKLSYIVLGDNCSGECCSMADIMPSHINGDDSFVYFTDACKGNTLFRLDVNGGFPVRICKESAEYLHVLDGKLVFWNGSKWKHIPLEGGAAEDVV